MLAVLRIPEPGHSQFLATERGGKRAPAPPRPAAAIPGNPGRHHGQR